jgi:hypothetical protein
VKHEFVLNEQCCESCAHPRIHYDLLSYDGVQTNCEEARVYVAIPILFGAFIDAWKESPIYSLIYVTDPWIGIAFSVFVIVGIIVGLHQLRIYLTECNVIETMRLQHQKTSIFPIPIQKKIN